MGTLEIERCFVEEVLLNTVLIFLTPKEIAKKTNQKESKVRTYLNRLEVQKIVIRHKFKCAYRLDRDYYLNNYIVKTTPIHNNAN